MAKQLYDVRFTSNFKFDKLSKNFDKLMEENNSEIIKDFTKATKEVIDKGKLPELTDATKDARSKGLNSFKFSVHPGYQTNADSMHKPLKYTGGLYDSIKATKKGISMESYGEKHHNGNWKTPSQDIGYGANKNVRPRPFIVGTEALPRDKKEMERLEADTVESFNKAMKK